MQSSDKIRWLAGAWGVVVLAVLICYIYKAWRKGVISMFGRFGSTSFSRESDPAMYWVMIVSYMAISLGLTLIVCLGFHNLISKAS
jgi:hypothetical protein